MENERLSTHFGEHQVSGSKVNWSAARKHKSLRPRPRPTKPRHAEAMISHQLLPSAQRAAPRWGFWLQGQCTQGHGPPGTRGPYFRSPGAQHMSSSLSEMPCATLPRPSTSTLSNMVSFVVTSSSHRESHKLPTICKTAAMIPP